MDRHSRDGYSLIQLSLVIVAAGLIVGAVLLGRSLMTTAEVQALTKQVQQIGVAVGTFEEKYDALPGDTKRVLPIGDGDKKLESAGQTDSGTAFTGEVANFWVHLSRTRSFIVPAPFQAEIRNNKMSVGNNGNANIPGVPMSPVNGAGVIATYDNGDLPPFSISSAYIFGKFTDNDGTNLSFANIGNAFVPMDVKALDNKMDDGNPKAGMMVSFTQGDAATDCFADDGGYDASVNIAACSFAIAAAKVAGDSTYTSSTSSSSATCPTGFNMCSDGATCCPDTHGCAADGLSCNICKTDETMCGATCCSSITGCAPDGMSCNSCAADKIMCGTTCCPASEGCAPDGVSCKICEPTEMLCGTECCPSNMGCAPGGVTCKTCLPTEMLCGTTCCPTENGCSADGLSCKACQPGEVMCGTNCCPGAKGCTADGLSCKICEDNETLCGTTCCPSAKGCAADGVSCKICEDNQILCGNICCSDDKSCSIDGQSCGCLLTQSTCGANCCDEGCNSTGESCACPVDSLDCGNGICCNSEQSCKYNSEAKAIGCEDGCTSSQVKCGANCCDAANGCAGDGTVCGCPVGQSYCGSNGGNTVCCSDGDACITGPDGSASCMPTCATGMSDCGGGVCCPPDQGCVYDPVTNQPVGCGTTCTGDPGCAETCGTFDGCSGCWPPDTTCYGNDVWDSSVCGCVPVDGCYDPPSCGQCETLNAITCQCDTVDNCPDDGGGCRFCAMGCLAGSVDYVEICGRDQNCSCSNGECECFCKEDGKCPNCTDPGPFGCD